MVEVVGNIVMAWVFADFIAGFWHWAEDRYFREDWPLIGEWVSKPNLRHHSQPQAFLEGSYWTRNWTTIVPAGIAALIVVLCNGPLWLLLGFLFATQANEVHAWAHRKGKLPRWIELFQETGIFQSPKHHSIHHTSPFDVNYCVMSNWLNPFLDHFGFWLMLEWLLAKVKIYPRDYDQN